MEVNVWIWYELCVFCYYEWTMIMFGRQLYEWWWLCEMLSSHTHTHEWRLNEVSMIVLMMNGWFNQLNSIEWYWNVVKGLSHNVKILSWKTILIFECMSFVMCECRVEIDYLMWVDAGYLVTISYHLLMTNVMNFNYSVGKNAKHQVDTDMRGNLSCELRWGF